MKRGFIYYLFFPFFFQAISLYAQNTLVFKNINVDNGLPQNTVLSVLQDKKGYLWAGTYDGLSKFNGLEFKIYKTEANNNRSLSNDKISKLFKDIDGHLWIGTFNGLNLFDPAIDGFTRIKLSNSADGNVVQTITQDKQGVLWIGTAMGLALVVPEKSDPKEYLVKRSNICGNDRITCLYVDDKQFLWIGAGQTLKIFNIEKTNLFSCLPCYRVIKILPAV